MNLFSNDLGTEQPYSLVTHRDDDLVIYNKKNHSFYEVISLEDIDHYVATQGFDSRLFDIITHKQYENTWSTYCTLIVDGKRVELSEFKDLQGIFIRCKG